jgi:hypothetical protein
LRGSAVQPFKEHRLEPGLGLALLFLADRFSGAEIEQAVISGLYEAFDRGKDLDQEILEAAIKATRPLAVLMAREIDSRRQWAEGRTRAAS